LSRNLPQRFAAHQQRWLVSHLSLSSRLPSVLATRHLRVLLLRAIVLVLNHHQSHHSHEMMILFLQIVQLCADGNLLQSRLIMSIRSLVVNILILSYLESPDTLRVGTPLIRLLRYVSLL